MLNRKSSLKFSLKQQSLPSEAHPIVAKLRKDGVAKVQFTDLLPSKLWEELSTIQYQTPETHISDKVYAYFHLPERKYDPDSIYARIAAHPTIKAIAQAYYKMDAPQLAYYDVWENFPTPGEAQNAQLWHRDRDDLKILKIFIYLTDVTEKNGPFYYASGTHLEGTIKKKPPFFLENGKVERSTDEQMATVVPKTSWQNGIAPRGTIVFADTHGYHKGGHVQEGRRLLFVAMYLSQASGRNRFNPAK